MASATVPRQRILIVDDQLSLAETLADGLSERGFEGVALASSRQAVEWLEKGHWDALVTDLRMPELDGLQLLAIRAPELPLVP